MTCKAANFGGFPHKRLKTESALVGDTFDVQRGPHLSILMCGTKATTGHREPISQVITRANKSSTLKHVLEDGLDTCGQTRSGGAVVNHEESPRPLTLCWLKKKTPASPTYSKKTCQTSLTLTLSNSSSAARIHLDSRLNGRKRVSQEDCSVLIASKRKKQDTNQSSEDAITCSQPQELHPLACSLDQAIPLNDDQRDADIELGDGDVYDKQTNGFVPQCFEVFVQTGPTISAPALPETPFDEDSDDLQARLEKQRRYREGLEKGMRNFLNQTLSVSLSTSELPEPEVSDQGTLLRSEAGQVNVQSNDQVVPHSVRPVFQMTDESHLMLEAAQGFVVMIDKQLRILYVSENVQQHLGHEQINMLGQDIEDYLHPKDVCDFKDQMSSKPSRLG
ncbi:hypoxia-inducible factor 1-alpha [Biomphalaria glabrata]|nr:hypoxia-inducible factor 1-alpha-like [Biomphalaria glabrata]